MAKVSGVSIEEAIARIKAAGLDSIAGAGAEMLPARPRKAIAPLKESGERWLEVMEIAHRLGVESTATMMMGTGETNAERIEHLRMIRDVQDRHRAAFRAFIPWTYQPENNHLKGRTQATSLEYLRLIAVARLFFDNVAHLQASWLTTGKDVGQLSLHMGVDDLGSIMLEENVISSAGARHRSNLHELIWMIRSADRIPAQRDTLYRHLRVHWTPADDPTDDRVRLALLLDRAARRRRAPLAFRCVERRLARRSAAVAEQPGEPRVAGQAAARGRRDVRRRGGRYDRTNTVISLRAGPDLAPGDPARARAAARASGCSTWAPAPASPPRSWPARARTRSAPTCRSACSPAGRRRRPGRTAARRRRARAAVRGRHLRRGDDLVRAAQRGRPVGRAARAGPGDPARAGGWSCASSAHPTNAAVPAALPPT